MKTALETPRLLLREMDLRDLDFIGSMLMDPEVMRYWPRPHTEEESAEWIAKQMTRYERDGYGYWLAFEKSLGAPIGQAGLLKTSIDGQEEPALGYIVHKTFWRRGYAAEATAACIKYVFCVLRRPRAVALVRPENGPSIGVAKKLGMLPERSILYAGLEHIVFSIPNRQAIPKDNPPG